MHSCVGVTIEGRRGHDEAAITEVAREFSRAGKCAALDGGVAHASEVQECGVGSCVVPIEGGVDTGWEAHLSFPGVTKVFSGLMSQGSELQDDTQGGRTDGDGFSSQAHALPAISPNGTQLAYVARLGGQ